MYEHDNSGKIAARKWNESGSLQLYDMSDPSTWIQADEGSYVDLADMC